MLRMGFLSPRKEMTSLKLATELITHEYLTLVRTRTAEILIKSKRVKPMFFPNIRKMKSIMIMEKISKEQAIFVVDKSVPGLDSTIRENTMTGTNGKLVQNHLKPILKITRRLVSTERKTGTRNMHIRNIPWNSAIGKPKPRTRREMRMASRVTPKRKE
jgi:hypothetical protein